MWSAFRWKSGKTVYCHGNMQFTVIIFPRADNQESLINQGRDCKHVSLVRVRVDFWPAFHLCCVWCAYLSQSSLLISYFTARFSAVMPMGILMCRSVSPAHRVSSSWDKGKREHVSLVLGIGSEQLLEGPYGQKWQNLYPFGILSLLIY
jgi:hypothetical protein